jgi:hypothetical protein
MGRELTVGEVVEIPTRKGFAYAQNTGRWPKWEYLIRVLPGTYKKRPTDLRSLVAQKERFVTFFALGKAIADGDFQLVGRENVPACPEPRLFRVRGFIDRAGKVRNWFIWDGKKSWRVEKLDDEQRRLPIRTLPNLASLIHKIENDWTPESDPSSF